VKTGFAVLNKQKKKALTGQKTALIIKTKADKFPDKLQPDIYF